MILCLDNLIPFYGERTDDVHTEWYVGLYPSCLEAEEE